jgi:methionine--tRNA ligase beta chain
MSYFYKSVEDCMASKQHMASCDADGFCNNCGEQLGDARDVFSNAEHLTTIKAPLPDPKLFIEPLVTPAFEGTFAEPATQAPFEPLPNMKYDDFIKFDIRTGTITLAEKIKKKDRLLHLEVYLGSVYGTRTIVAGIAEHFDPTFLIGMQVMVVTNLEPRKLGGYESHGMILAGMGPTGLSLTGCMGVPDGTEIG